MPNSCSRPPDCLPFPARGNVGSVASQLPLARRPRLWSGAVNLGRRRSHHPSWAGSGGGGGGGVVGEERASVQCSAVVGLI